MEACRCLLSLEPWHEDAELLGVRSCVALGDVAGARRLYRKIEQVLAAELGAAPQPHLRSYYESLTPHPS